MSKRDIFSPAQCAGGRGMLGWSRDLLAERASLDIEAVALFEEGAGDLAHEERIRLGRAFNAAGLIAIASQYAGEGVRFSEPHAQMSLSSGARGQADPFPRGF